MNSSNCRSFAAVLLSVCLLASSAVMGADSVKYDKAIKSVYPALVQIYVLALDHREGRERKFQSSGSGAIISEDGYVVTNHHVAGRSAAIRVILPTREEVEAKLVGTDALSDIAVLKLDLSTRHPDAPKLGVAKFGDSDSMKVGDPVLAMGCPLALSQSVTVGILSNRDMTIPRGQGTFVLDGEEVGSLVKWFGHDAVIFPGNSGGPLVNAKGEIIGVNEIGAGLGGAIPSNIARAVVDEIIQNGAVTRAWIGLKTQPLLKLAAMDPNAKGALVAGTVPGSPSEQAGLRAGDIITAVDGVPIQVRFEAEMPAFTKLLLSKPLNTAMKMKVLRDGRETDVTVMPMKRDEAMARESEIKEWGISVRRVTVMESKAMQRLNTDGVLVGSLRPGGPADKAQPALRPYDIIVEVAGKPVTTLDSFKEITAAIIAGKTAPVPTLVAYDRGTERGLTVVEVGMVTPQDPPAEARKPWMPVATQVLSRKLAEALNLPGKKGVRLTQVYPDSTAATAGFQVGDIVTHIDGNQIEASEPQHQDVFDSMIRAYRLNSKAEFTVIRKTETMKLTCDLTAAPKPERELRVYEDLVFEFKARDVSFMDRIRARWNKDESGVLISQVDAGGWAAVGQLMAGDLVKSINGSPVKEVADLEKLMKSAFENKMKNVVIFVKRGILGHYVELQPTWDK